MKISRPIVLWSIVAILSLMAVVAWSSREPDELVLHPPYPEVNATGDPIQAVYEGRIPCAPQNCDKMKIALVLYHDRVSRAPTTYWFGSVSVFDDDDRLVTQGRWTEEKGVRGYPDAVVYVLDSNTPPELRYFWRVNDDIVLPLDPSMSPKVGNASWGYMLSRYAEGYGPRAVKKKTTHRIR
jgi:hypothetical protein